MDWLVEPGFWTNEPVRNALIVGLFVAASSAVVGVMVVVRAQTFAGHALADVATAGGASSSVLGVPAAAGFLAGGVVGAGAIEAIGVNRVRGRDIATGIVLGAATGLAALFFYVASTRGTSSASTQQILFGSIFTVPSSTIPLAIVVSTGVLAVLAAVTRPLTLVTVSESLALVRGVPVRLVNSAFIATIAVVVALASIVVGSILSTALLVGPAALALRVTRSLTSAYVTAASVGVIATWLGILVSYDSYVWSGTGHALPASFCIVAILIGSFSVVSFVVGRRRRRGTR